MIDFGLGAHAAGDDHLAVVLDCRADGFQGFGLGAIEKTAGIDYDKVGVVVPASKLIAFGTQPGDDAL